MFFVLGMCAPVTLMFGGRTVLPYYQSVLYLAAAGVFWAWLFADARARNVPFYWTLLVSAAWLIASVFVAFAYLVATRGVRKGAVASMALIAIVLQFFAVLAVGVILSVEAANFVGR